MPLRLLIVLLVVAGTAPLMADENPKPNRILVIAHRGAHQKAPENTLASFQHAIDLGCDYVEVDVRRTSDGVLVLMHDSDVARTTDGTGKVNELTYADIQKLTVGQSEKVPTFDEALKLCRGKIKIYIDHKDAPPAEIVETVTRHKMVNDVIVYSSYDGLRAFKKLNPKIWIMPPNPGSIEKINTIRRDLKAETFDGNVRDWNIELAKAAHAAGAQIWVDNLGEHDNEAGFQKSLDLGVDAIQTDYPEKLIPFLKRLGRR